MAEYIVNINEDVLGEFDFIAVESLREHTPLIRCKDCKYSRGEPIADGRYWCIESCGYFQFCSEAERKDND